ncbi:MAG: tRNA (N(6)-L-threonylcarbamoyladenosine(37)-C(2))-methylthiotransferase MtaB [Rhodospirillales bacterium]|nr:tRNA (N(6)-L-threonylcarbamoyladenosine(37)-C(2))-methylthiotransferase MtaB [Rhodospirillales bacterium]
MAEPRILTFGCRLNAYESEVMRGHLEAAGAEDLIVVNSCAVTAEAERQVRQAIRKAHRETPEAKIVVTGCAAQINPAAYAALPGVARVVGNAGKLRPESWHSGPHPEVEVDDIMALRGTASHLRGAFAGRTRAFVQIQQGCDHRCTFCVIPYGRGNNRSVPLAAVVEEVRGLAAAGVREVVLTGVDITGYGSDLPGRPSLGQLCRRLLNLAPELRRLRLSSLDPVEMDDALFALLASDRRLMPHLHLSVQAGSDLILKRMKRRHLKADVLAAVARAKAARPETVFGADLIAGFPTESEAAFEETLALVEAADLTYLHVFPYSERAGTPAARMPQVPRPLRKERAGRLRALGQERLKAHLLSQVGRQAQVLVEKTGLGRADNFSAVALPAEAAVGSVIDIRLVAARPPVMEGVLL